MSIKFKLTSPYLIYGLIFTIITLVLFYFVGKTGLGTLPAYFLAINICQLLAYGYDKLISSGRLTRVPEWVLHIIALAGGSPAALAAQKLFRHKTIKRPFQLVFWIIVILQLAILAYLFIF